jgi:hypothetical protein
VAGESSEPAAYGRLAAAHESNQNKIRQHEGECFISGNRRKPNSPLASTGLLRSKRENRLAVERDLLSNKRIPR